MSVRHPALSRAAMRYLWIGALSLEIGCYGWWRVAGLLAGSPSEGHGFLWCWPVPEVDVELDGVVGSRRFDDVGDVGRRSRDDEGRDGGLVIG